MMHYLGEPPSFVILVNHKSINIGKKVKSNSKVSRESFNAEVSKRDFSFSR